MRTWLVVGLLTSTVVLLVISLSAGVTVSQIASFGYIPLGLAAATVIVKLVLQVIKFRILARGFSGNPGMDLSGAGKTRIGSEFVALSTPSMIGGEFVRAAWLASKGMEAGRALWIGYVEVCIDVYIGCAISLVAAAYAFTRGAVLLSTVISLAILPVIVAYTAFILVSFYKGIRIPTAVFDILALFLGEASARRLEARVKRATDDFGKTAKLTMRKDSFSLILKAACLGSAQALLSGVTLWLLLNPGGLRIDPISSTLAVFGVQAIASLPITIGGAGTSELGLQWYLSSVYGFSSWASVVVWRLLSYQLVLLISGPVFIVFLKGMVKKDAEPSPRLDVR